MIRTATADDLPAIAAIYDHHARNGIATFDTEGPSVVAWGEKMAMIQQRGWPFLAIEEDGALAGFAYASFFRDRRAYDWTCEDSVYVAPGREGRGIGKALMRALMEAARAAGFRQMLALIGGGSPASVALHAACGFVPVGTFRGVGQKFGQTLDVALMQASLEA
ncbi:N-acetyltransferase family protein [Sphingomonas sp. ASV193]|uniref:GNAT family N-acetyltransferase n=1 Tax=Sphingomonas sp. ASV193 TaxID=3144405 RepID=UPI0032E89230